MPATFRVEIDTYTYNAALDWVTSTPQTITVVVDTYVKPAVLEVVERELVPYPGPIRKGAFRELATPKQFRYVMAKIRRGEWTGRTGELGRKWIVRAVPMQRGSSILVANTSSIAKFVVGRFQQRFHFDTQWKTLQAQEFTIVGAARVAFHDGYKTYQQQTFRKIRAR